MIRSNVLKRLISASPLKRRFLMVLVDTFIVFISTFLSFWLLSSKDASNITFLGYLIILITCISTYIFTKQYNSLTRFVDTSLIYNIFLRNILVYIILFFISSLGFLNLNIDVKSLVLLFSFLYTFTLSIRFILRDFLIKAQKRDLNNLKKVAIYGAGSAGAQLSSSLNIARSHNIVFFIDDSVSLKNRSINNIPIISSSKMEKYFKRTKIDQILLAMPSVENKRKREIIKNLYKFNIPVLQVPSIEQIETGEASINNLRPINIDDLLGRDKVTAYSEFLGPGIVGKTICITGAGGSIGNELALQVLDLNPFSLILLDINEFNLYKIKEIIQKRYPENNNVKYILGNASSESLIESCFKKYKVNIVFHAAAYKHVPIVEENPIDGLDNNVNSTFVVAKYSSILGIEKMILISSDKAVRPTNIMGASKRLSELIIQSFADKESNNANKDTCFSIVRFGNVLASSGSVVPLFEKQIKLGGPLTVTHKDIMRYFMTIKEAASLVLQTASLAKGGEVFLLDMGKPISIMKLAKQMIRLSGLTLKDSNNPKGDIEIITTGLRPGEKLYEELLIEENAEKTLHPLIYMAKENFLKSETLFPELLVLNELIRLRDKDKIFKKLSELVTEWRNSKS